MPAASIGTKAPRQFQGIFDVIPFKVTVDPAAFVDNESQVVAVTGVTGAEVGDIVLVGPGVDMAEAVYNAYVISADTVEITIAHVGGDSTNLASSTWNGVVLKPKGVFDSL
jgi:hypothetical protein